MHMRLTTANRFVAIAGMVTPCVRWCHPCRILPIGRYRARPPVDDQPKPGFFMRPGPCEARSYWNITRNIIWRKPIRIRYNSTEAGRIPKKFWGPFCSVQKLTKAIDKALE